MRFNYYRIIYFNIILIILYLCNQFCLFFLIFFFKIPYLLNDESDIEYQFNFQTTSFEDIGSNYLENDIDNDFYYTLQHMQSYLYSNCRFFFDVLGGETTLDYVDFLDFTIYKINDIAYNNINRNYKYIYNNNIIFKSLKNYNIFKMYTIIDEARTNNYQVRKIKYLQNYINDIKQKQNNNNIMQDITKITKSNKLTLYDKQIKIQSKIQCHKNLYKQNKKNIFMFDELLIGNVKSKLRKKA